MSYSLGSSFLWRWWEQDPERFLYTWRIEGEINHHEPWKVNRWSPKRLMLRFDFYDAFLLLLFLCTDVPPAKTQAKDTNSALQSGLRSSDHLCQTGEQKVCSCVVCLQFLTTVPQVCYVWLQLNDCVCQAHAHTPRQKLERKWVETAPWSHDAWANIRLYFCLQSVL